MEIIFPVLYSDLFGKPGEGSVFRWPLCPQNVIFSAGQQSSAGSLGRKKQLKSSTPTDAHAECTCTCFRYQEGHRSERVTVRATPCDAPQVRGTLSLRTSANQILHFILKYIHWNFETEIFKLQSCCFTRAVLPWTYRCTHFQDRMRDKMGMAGLTDQFPISPSHQAVIRSSSTWREAWIPLGFISSNYPLLPPHVVLSFPILYFPPVPDIALSSLSPLYSSSMFTCCSPLVVTVCLLGGFSYMSRERIQRRKMSLMQISTSMHTWMYPFSLYLPYVYFFRWIYR